MNIPATLEQVRSVDEVVHRVAEIAESLELVDLREAIEIAEEAAALAAHKRLKRYVAIHDDADKARRSLQGLAVQAERHAGKLLSEFDGHAPAGGRGKGKAKSERAKVAEDLGIERRKAGRLVELAEIPDEVIPAICAQLEAKGKAVTTTGVIKAAKSESVIVPGTTRDDCYTQPDFFVPVRKTFGGATDSDLTSCLTAQGWIRARAWWSLRSPHDKDEQARARAAWTAMGWSEAKQRKAIEHAIETWRGLGGEKDGRLSQKPAGTTFGQPPYSCPEATIYTITDEYKAKRVTQAIILLNCATETAVQQHLLELSSARLWIGKGEDHHRTRMAFYRPTGQQQKQNDRGQVAYFLGDKPTTFAANFGGWGVVKIG